MVATTAAPHVVGAFEDSVAAEGAVQELRRAGFATDEIGVLARDTAANAQPQVEAETEPETGAAIGAVTGGVLGGILGVALALSIPGIGTVLAGGILAGILGGTTLGITGGGLVGAMIGMGLSEEEAQHYEEEFASGHVLVVVKADGRHAEARDILTRCGALVWTSSDATPAAV